MRVDGLNGTNFGARVVLKNQYRLQSDGGKP